MPANKIYITYKSYLKIFFTGSMYKIFDFINLIFRGF